MPTQQNRPSPEKVRLGVIGLGLIGTPHVRTLRKVEECDLVAISDIDEKHKETAAKLGIKFYLNYEGSIQKESLQGVIIATPVNLHVPMGITCAQKGLHLFVEKPIAASLSEADRLIGDSERERGLHPGRASKKV